MFFKRKEDYSLSSPVNGEFIPLSQVGDSTFSGGLMGNGFGVQPESDIIRSPISGIITMVFPTKHAIGIKRDDGLEVLLHVGIETVNLNGKGYQLYKHTNEYVKKNDAILKYDRKLIKDHQYDDTVICILANSSDFDISFENDLKNVDAGEKICYAKPR